MKHISMIITLELALLFSEANILLHYLETTQKFGVKFLLLKKLLDLRMLMLPDLMLKVKLSGQISSNKVNSEHSRDGYS